MPLKTKPQPGCADVTAHYSLDGAKKTTGSNVSSIFQTAAYRAKQPTIICAGVSFISIYEAIILEIK